MRRARSGIFFSQVKFFCQDGSNKISHARICAQICKRPQTDRQTRLWFLYIVWWWCAVCSKITFSRFFTHCGRASVINQFQYWPSHYFDIICNSSLVSESLNGRYRLTYVVKNTFSSTAGACEAWSLVQVPYVHVGSKTVPMRYRTPAYTHTRPNGTPH